MGKSKTRVKIFADTQSESYRVSEGKIVSKRDWRVCFTFKGLKLRSEVMSQGEAYLIVSQLIEALDLDGTVIEEFK